MPRNVVFDCEVYHKELSIMNCLNPTKIMTPESRWLRKCIKEGRSFEYYFKHANVRRNLLLDPVPLIQDPYEYYDVHPNVRWQNVPCGHCENCVKRKVNDYFIRNYYEYVDTVANGGTSYFLTMTFAPELLPTLSDGTPCFDSEIIKRFLKRFRNYLERKFKYESDFKYFIVSEYGGEFGRPHHHGVFHMTNWPNSLSNQYRMKQALAYSWTTIADRKEWFANDELDFATVQRVDVKPIDNAAGINYVCKYIGKQIGAEEFDMRHVEYRYRRNHWQSIGLGLCMTKYVDSNEFRDGLVTINGFKYPLPIYLATKLKREFYCYNDDGSIIYQPTDFARDSVRKFTLDRLQEYKDLSCLNKGFPKASPILYDPQNLALLKSYLSKYSGFEFVHDFSGADSARWPEIEIIVDAINEFFDAVDAWYKPKYAAQAELYKQHQKELWQKKTHRK